MKLISLRILSTMILLICFTSTANATLISRLGGQAFYDDVLDITWLADVNTAAGSVFDDGSSSTDGRMTWASANNWAASLNISGVTGWRLPTAEPINGTAYNTTPQNDGSSDVGYNISRPLTVYGGSTANEMAHLFYNTLNNVSRFNTGGIFVNGCPNSGRCLTNSGPFTNLIAGPYWSGSEFDTSQAWEISFYLGNQNLSNKDNGTILALAVHTGDVAAVPVPAAVWLMGSAMFGLVGFGRKKVVPADF